MCSLVSWIVWRKETGTFCTMTRAAVYLVTLHVARGGHSVGTVPAAVCSDIPKIALKAPKKKSQLSIPQIVCFEQFFIR